MHVKEVLHFRGYKEGEVSTRISNASKPTLDIVTKVISEYSLIHNGINNQNIKAYLTRANPQYGPRRHTIDFSPFTRDVNLYVPAFREKLNEVKDQFGPGQNPKIGFDIEDLYIRLHLHPYTHPADQSF